MDLRGHKRAKTAFTPGPVGFRGGWVLGWGILFGVSAMGAQSAEQKGSEACLSEKAESAHLRQLKELERLLDRKMDFKSRTPGDAESLFICERVAPSPRKKGDGGKKKIPRDPEKKPYPFHYDLEGVRQHSFGDGSVRNLSKGKLITSFNDTEAGSLSFSRLLIRDLKKIAPTTPFVALEETTVGATANLMLFISPRGYSQMVHDIRDVFSRFDLLLTVGIQQRSLQVDPSRGPTAPVRKDTGFGMLEARVPVRKSEKIEGVVQGGIYFQPGELDLGEERGEEETSPRRSYLFAGGSLRMILGSPAEEKNFVKLGPEWNFLGDIRCTLQEPSGTEEKVQVPDESDPSGMATRTEYRPNEKARFGVDVRAGFSRESRFLTGTKHRLEIHAIGSISRNPTLLGRDRGSSALAAIEIGAKLKLGAVVQRSYRGSVHQRRRPDGSIK